MNSKKQTQGGFFHMGTISLLTVFLVLVLVVLALLMLAGARQDLQYSQNLAQRKTAYYEAHNQAQRIHRQVLEELSRETPDFSSLPVTVGQDTISWQVPLGDSQVLEAVLSREGITAWKIH